MKEVHGWRRKEMTMGFEKFVIRALEPDGYLRQGQSLMCHLREHRPDLYDRIMSDPPGMPGSAAPHDCFFDDSKMWGTIGWLRENW